MGVLTIRNLQKTYANGTRALKGINLTIPPGMYGLLGPNGAGKSTLMRTIATLQDADTGDIFLDELDVLKEKNAVRQILGFLPQEFDVYPKSTAIELLNHLAILKGVTNAPLRKKMLNTILEKTNLEHLKNNLLGSFSGGMKQRFGVAQALINNPKILIVDEPTAGLDPEERNRLHNILGELSTEHIVILSTHIVSDVTQLCHKMAIINQGEVLVEKHPLSVIDVLNDKLYRKVINKNELTIIEQDYQVLSTKMFMGQMLVHVYAESTLDQSFEKIRPDLEDAYFYYIHQHNLNITVSR